MPALLVLAVLADGASRFLPLDGLAIRAWEAMSRGAFTEGGIPFEPSRHYLNEHAFGDIVAATNRPALRQYRREEFTTDAWGYRNRPVAPNAPAPEIVIVGSSFSVGSGVSDDETLAAVLARSTGKGVYNAAGGTPSPERIRAIAARLGMQHGTVVLELYESNGFPERPRPAPRLHQACVDRLGATCLALKAWLRASPLQIVVQRAYRALEDDRWLPNSLDPGGAPPRLTDGTAMLFSERAPVTCPGITEAAAEDYFRWFREALPGFELLVVLVPSKISVYGPLIATDGDPERAPGSGTPPIRLPPSGRNDDALSATAAPPPPPAPERCGKRVAAATRKLAIPFVDLTDELRSAADTLYPRHSYVYFLDDTHWNQLGIEVAARAIVRHWPASALPDGRPPASAAP